MGNANTVTSTSAVATTTANDTPADEDDKD
jgi:hypothetical protein